ncbi:MAG: hypothetical protein FJ291_28890 [Planctomycetes bacterium]|nr:hypothetical protein [Planctomycetota bacterium]
MRCDLAAGTDVARYAIFDPSAMLRVINDPKLDHIDEDVIATDMEKGNVLLYSWGSDGGTRFRMCLDEDPEQEVTELAIGRKDRMLLRVPTGTLFAVGLEYLCRPGEPPIAPDQFAKAVGDMGQGAAIPPGNYAVDGFQLQREAPTVFLAGTATCLGMFLTIVGTAIVVVGSFVAPLFGGDWRDVWLYWPGALILYWAIVATALAIGNNSPSARRRRQRVREREERFPFDAVLVLRRLPDDADLTTLRGGAFGSYYEGQ